MKIISELTNKEYSSVDECLADENAWKAKLEEERKANIRRKEEMEAHKARVEELRINANNAFKEYQKASAEYNKKYCSAEDILLKFLFP